MNKEEEKIVEIKTLKIKNLALILSIILLVIFLTNAVNLLVYLIIPFGGIILIFSGIEMIIASVVCLHIYKKRMPYNCPSCGKSRTRYRKLEKTVYNETRYYHNYYIDLYECPNCKNVTEIVTIKQERIKTKKINSNLKNDTNVSEIKEI